MKRAPAVVFLPNYEFADYYRWDRGNLGIVAETKDMLPSKYARAALQQGLAWEANLGVSPYKFGSTGSTDSHTSLATIKEAHFFGKASGLEPGTGDARYRTAITQQFTKGESLEEFGYDSLLSGLVGVWPHSNTRKELFAAMARREAFGTTVTRMRLRMFGGWEFSKTDLTRPDLSRTGCVKDVLHEKVCNVAWSGERKPGRGGKLPMVGNTVKGADYSNSIGAAILSAYWQDPNFKAGARAFYYARLLEIPTPSWIAYDMATFKIAKSAPNAVLVQKKRAYSSPIWYSPKG